MFGGQCYITSGTEICCCLTLSGFLIAQFPIIVPYMIERNFWRRLFNFSFQLFSSFYLFFLGSHKTSLSYPLCEYRHFLTEVVPFSSFEREQPGFSEVWDGKIHSLWLCFFMEEKAHLSAFFSGRDIGLQLLMGFGGYGKAFSVEFPCNSKQCELFKSLEKCPRWCDILLHGKIWKYSLCIISS